MAEPAALFPYKWTMVSLILVSWISFLTCDQAGSQKQTEQDPGVAGHHFVVFFGAGTAVVCIWCCGN